MLSYRPEGQVITVPSEDELRQGAGSGEIFQARCVKCDEFHNLHVDLGPIRGLIPREETALGITEDQTKDIAILSRVGKTVSFQILGFDHRGVAILSRRAAQAEARNHFLSALSPGDVIPALVQNAADFGVFCDIGCGFPALMRIDRCCISRLQSTKEHYRTGMPIFAAILNIDYGTSQINLTGRELLGTWAENAARFRAGQTVLGTVRSMMSYGAFIELTPNLSGLAETALPVEIGDSVSVYIRSINPEKHKIKLTVLEILPEKHRPKPTWFITSGHLERWEYFPGSNAVTVF